MEFDWSCQEAALPFRTSSVVIRKVILRLIRFDLLCRLNASGISVRTLDQSFLTTVRPRPGKFFFHKTRAQSQQIYSSVRFQFFFKVHTLN